MPKNGKDKSTEHKQRVRRNIKCLSAHEKRVLVNAFLKLKRTPSPLPDSRGMSYYDHLVSIHLHDPPDNLFAHRGPHFGVWHRYYLLLLETALNSVRPAGEPEISLPYWNWTEGASTLALFSPDMIGTNGVGPEMTIRNSAFATDFPINIRSEDEKHAPNVIRRSFGSEISTTINNTLLVPVSVLDQAEAPTDVGPSACPDSHTETQNFTSVELPNPTQVNIVLARPVFEVQPFNMNSDSLISFRNLYEGWHNFQNERKSVLHNVVHIWVGGDMDTLASPNDPAFWFHHAFVDSLYWSWQKLHPFISARGVGDNYNVRLTKIPKWRVRVKRGSSTIQLEQGDDDDNAASTCFSRYFAPGYYINVESDAPEAFTDAKGRSYESFVVDTVTPREIRFQQQVGQNTYTFNNITNGRGYVSEVLGSLAVGSNVLQLLNNSGESIEIKYIEQGLRVGDRIAVATTEADANPHGTPAPMPAGMSAAERTFLARVTALGSDGRSVVLDRANELSAAISNGTVFRQSFYRGSTGSKSVYLGAHWGSNLDDFLVDFPDKHVVIRSLVKPDELPYRYDFDLHGSVPLGPSC